MPNNKMMALAVTILETMMKVFPQEHLDFMFCGLLDPGDVVEMVMLDLIKRTYDKTEEKHALRYFYDKYGITEMDQIMRYSRIQSYVMKYRQREYNIRSKEEGHEIFEEMNDLLPPVSMPFLFCMFSPFKKCSFLVKKILLIKQCIDSFLFFFHEFFPFF